MSAYDSIDRTVLDNLSSGRERNAGEHQEVADSVKELQSFTQQCDRQYRAEDRDQMDEWRRPVGTDELDATVEKQVTENRGEDAKIEQAESAEVIEHDRLPVCDLQRHAWQQHDRAATHADGKKGKRMDQR